MSMLSGIIRTVFAVVVSLVVLAPCTALGAGFALIEQGVSGLGNAYAGGSAIAEDATTVFFNPAGLMRLQGQQFIAAAHIVIPSAKFHNDGSTQLLQPRTGVPLLGDNGGEGGQTKVVPNLYYSIKISDRLAAGIGINAPFGLGTKYDDTWVGRYYAIKSDVLTVNINPSVAYRIGDHLTVGAGISAQYLEAELSNAIDFGTIDAVGGFGLPPGTFKLTPQGSDGYVDLKGHSWAFGFNAGLLYEFTPNTRVGVAYRSSVKQELKGTAYFSSVPASLSVLPAFKNSTVYSDIRLPQSLSVSFAHSFNPQWTVMADFTWTDWSVFRELRINFQNPFQPASVTTENWQDNYRYSIGATFRPTEQWALRAGVAYDTSATSSEEYRTPRIPDSYRTWLAVGAGYKFSKMFSADIGYAHIFVSDPAINKNPVGEDALRGGLKGTFDAHINIVSAQLNVNF